MNIDVAVRLLRSLSPGDKARAFARLCHDLTVVARDTYDSEGNVKDTGRLRALNEIQHRMTGFLLALMSEDATGYSDQSVATMFLADREDAHLARLLAFAFERCCGNSGEIKG
jgi:hypothetical protein